MWCAGYRPILDAAKSFAKDTDVKDMVCGRMYVSTRKREESAQLMGKRQGRECVMKENQEKD